MSFFDDEELRDFIQARNEAFRKLDIRWAMNMGCPEHSALGALHKARYECVEIEPALRHESRRWLEEHGFSRRAGLPWPPEGELPE